MLDLTDRLKLVMTKMGWEHSDVMRVSGQSSSVVSQWLGRGSKTIHSIGKIEAAQRLAYASGFSALWIAKGIGPMHQEESRQRQTEEEAPLAADLVESLADMLRGIEKSALPIISELLATLGKSPDSDIAAATLSEALMKYGLPTSAPSVSRSKRRDRRASSP